MNRNALIPIDAEEAKKHNWIPLVETDFGKIDRKVRHYGLYRTKRNQVRIDSTLFWTEHEGLYGAVNTQKLLRAYIEYSGAYWPLLRRFFVTKMDDGKSFFGFYCNYRFDDIIMAKYHASMRSVRSHCYDLYCYTDQIDRAVLYDSEWQCQYCGCTDNRGCFQGCSWVTPWLCSQCCNGTTGISFGRHSI